MSNMNNITYIYGTMNAGKTAQAVMLAYSLKNQGKNVKVYTVDPDRTNCVASILESRPGISTECTKIGPNYDFSSFVMLNHQNLDVIIVDECQFLTEAQVEYLAYCNKKIFFVGVKVNYLGEIFKSVQKILTFEPDLVHIPSICTSPNCLERATHHLLEVDGKIIKEGYDKVVGDVNGDRIKYYPVCKMHYIFKVTSQEELDNVEVKQCV